MLGDINFIREAELALGLAPHNVRKRLCRILLWDQHCTLETKRTEVHSIHVGQCGIAIFILGEINGSDCA